MENTPIMPISDERKEFEKWLERVTEEADKLMDGAKENVPVFKDYRIKLRVFDEWEELGEGVESDEDKSALEKILSEAEKIEAESGHQLERYGCVCFNYYGDNIDLIKRHVNFNVHESSIQWWYKRYKYQKADTFDNTAYKAAVYCYRTFLEWFTKRAYGYKRY